MCARSCLAAGQKGCMVTVGDPAPDLTGLIHAPDNNPHMFCMVIIVGGVVVGAGNILGHTSPSYEQPPGLPDRPFDAGCLPLSFRGNPGVNGVAYRDGTVSPKTRCRSTTSAAHIFLTVFLCAWAAGGHREGVAEAGRELAELHHSRLLFAQHAAAAAIVRPPY
jgi:hypothetical protein